MKPTIDPEEWIVSLQDVKRLYISMWKRLLKWAWIGALTAFLYFGSLETKYRAQASFKEGIERTNSESFFKEMLGGISPTAEPQTTSVMKSNQVLRPLVEKLGLQIQPISSEWKLAKFWRRYRNNWKAEKGYLLKDPDPFIFGNVCYEGEKGIFFNIRFSSDMDYEIYDEKKKERRTQGKVGVPCCFDEVELTLQKVPNNLKLGRFYPFFASHWISAVGSIQSRIKIKNDKDNKSILLISVVNANRHLAAQIVNELMVQYRTYLKKEYNQVASEQLAYLEDRQNQIFSKMDQLFDQHTAYLSQNIGEKGFIGLDQEMQNLLVPHQQMHSKLLAIDVELRRLSEIEKGGKAVAIAEDGLFSQGVNQLAQRIRDLRQQRDLIELSFCEANEKAFQEKREELRGIRDQRFALEKLIQEMDRGEEITSLDFNPDLCDWAKRVSDSEEREDFAEYLENYARLLSMREKMLQERFFYANGTPKELEGMDLVSARNLFLQYNNKLDIAEASLRSLAQLKKEIPNSQFDLTSLSSVLHDPLSQKIIAEAGQLEIQLKDEKYHSAKEGERWKEELSLRRKILMDHLDQLMQVEGLNIDLTRQKMAGLQKVSLDCINQQISVLHEQAGDMVKERRKALLMEKELLEKKMETIRSSLAAVLPEKWRFEKWLGIKTSMMNRVMETVAEVAESKAITSRLHHVESKPLDPALVPGGPIPPCLYRMICLGAILFPFLIFSFALIRQLLKGFPATQEKLKALRFPVLGEISSFCDGPLVGTPSGPDLELLRGIAHFSEKGKVIGLIGGRGPDYSYALGENLARRQVQSVMVRCDFLAKFREGHTPGLLQVWEGKVVDPPIRKGKGFDYILAGGYTPFGTEIIQSYRFQQLIDLLKGKYDWVFLLIRSPLVSAESLSVLRFCDQAVVTVSGEQIEELTPFVHWGYDEGHCRVTFVITS